MTLEEKIDKLVLDLIYTGSMLPKGKTIGASMFPEHKQAILALIKKETVKAKSDELKRIDKANIDNGINFWFEDMKPQNNGWRNMRQYVPDRIAQLKAELKQSNNKDT